MTYKKLPQNGELNRFSKYRYPKLQTKNPTPLYYRWNEYHLRKAQHTYNECVISDGRKTLYNTLCELKLCNFC